MASLCPPPPKPSAPRQSRPPARGVPGKSNCLSVNGQGTYVFSDGRKYVGEFRDDKPNGEGEFSFPDGRKYVGEFKDGDPNGQGKHICLNGVFVGEFRAGLDYRGVFTGKDGTIITGIFSGEKKSGTIIYPDGRKYEGEWSSDREALGLLEEVPPGFWTYERPHGVGKMTYPGGRAKHGIWRSGEFKSGLEIIEQEKKAVKEVRD